jgi:hypothetical protein
VIRKGSYYYRANCQGYTGDLSAAGRYTEAKARREAAVEPWHMEAIHAPLITTTTVPTADAELAAARDENARLREALEKIKEIAEYNDRINISLVENTRILLISRAALNASATKEG